MNRNQLKVIACISMLIDHIGYVIFPNIAVLRIIGRIAMPIFAFFIGEGCLYTKNRKKYFLRVFLLGLLCQSVYIIESLINGSGNGTYFNILFTFSISILLCNAFLNAKSSIKSENRLLKAKKVAIFLLTLAGILTLTAFCENSLALTGIKIEFDYGICGICLPLFACASKDRTTKLTAFSLTLIICIMMLYGNTIYRLFAVLPAVLLICYNGKPGKANLKYLFYAFYPCHLALIYLVNIII